MNVSIIARLELTGEEERLVSLRVNATEHKYDNGAIKVWEWPSAEENTYVAFVEQGHLGRTPFGLLHAGGPLDNVVVAWWIDKQFRGQHLGKPMVDAMANLLRIKRVTAIGRIVIDTYAGEYHSQSLALAGRLRSYFADPSIV